ncbi:unnamed protein product [Spirodela intermedia]|uniref:galactinol--sucrose galactosyltransferase n=1 Tax=Spirodela intermedia TaxID=51605 RepID=A0A7I8J635_SPIIN|nr:unnamed protein product [Spirodela intermedia]CAA6665509.1 unnamed protein product [Spirodela intermedia]
MAPLDPNQRKNAEAITLAAAMGGHKPACTIALQDRTFSANGQPFLLDVPLSVVATPASSVLPEDSSYAGTFVGWHAFQLGRLLGIRFMSIFRFKVWWTTHWVGNRGGDLEHETQFMILDKSSDGARPYVLLLPIIEGPFRSSLQPGADDYVEVCVESGSTRVTAASFRSSLFMHAGDDPFVLVREAMKVMQLHMGTFRLLEEKTPPPIVDKFGWCTWDAFYLNVHPEGIWEGVKGLVDGGCPPGLVIIDDGWQSICHDDDDPASGFEGMNRTSFQENYKFRDYQSPNGGESSGMGAFTRDLKATFKTVEDVYVWHALCGYWGGLRPGTKGLPESKVMTMEDLAVDKIVNNGVGMVPPEKAWEMYDGLHSHLASLGISGVKVDVIHLLEMLCEDFGGRVDLAKPYYKALTDSVRKNFGGNGVIASMEHCNDFMFLGTETISLGRVGDDFWCTDPSGDPNGAFWLQGCHMVHCAYNSLWMANFIHPDWDMFQSTHPCAEFHAASRAISGGPIYVSDSVGQHDFRLLKSFVLPDGSILRCEHYALPTRDCLFEDPLHDGKTMLKIWNLNKCTGVLGAFNCQGGGWCRQSRRNKCFAEFSVAVKATARPREIEWSNGKSSIVVDDGTELFAVYSSKSGKLSLLSLDDGIDVYLEPFDCVLFTVSPIKTLPSSSSEMPGVQFAPIGLTNMLNSGGAVRSVEFAAGGFKVAVRGSGEMKAFASEQPATCRINGEDASFTYGTASSPSSFHGRARRSRR